MFENTDEPTLIDVASQTSDTSLNLDRVLFEESTRQNELRKKLSFEALKIILSEDTFKAASHPNNYQKVFSKSDEEDIPIQISKCLKEESSLKQPSNSLVTSSSEFLLQNMVDFPAPEEGALNKQSTKYEIKAQRMMDQEGPIKMQRELSYPQIHLRRLKNIIINKQNKPNITIPKVAPLKYWNPVKPAMIVYLAPHNLEPRGTSIELQPITSNSEEEITSSTFKESNLIQFDEQSQSQLSVPSELSFIISDMAEPSFINQPRISKSNKLEFHLRRKNRSAQTETSCTKENEEFWLPKTPEIHPEWAWKEFDALEPSSPVEVIEEFPDLGCPFDTTQEMLHKHCLSAWKEYNEESRAVARIYQTENQAIYDKYHINEPCVKEFREFIKGADPSKATGSSQIVKKESLNVLSILEENKSNQKGGDLIIAKWEKYFDSNIDMTGSCETGTLYLFLKDVKLDPHTDAKLQQEFCKPHLFLNWEFLESPIWNEFSPIKSTKKLTFNCLTIYSGPVSTEFLHYIAKHKHPVIIYAVGRDSVCRPIARGELLLYNTLFNVGKKCDIKIRFNGIFGDEYNGEIRGWVKLEGDHHKVCSYLELKRKKHYKMCEIRRYVFINGNEEAMDQPDSSKNMSSSGIIIKNQCCKKLSQVNLADQKPHEHRWSEENLESSKRNLLATDLNDNQVIFTNRTTFETEGSDSLTTILIAKIPELKNIIPQNWGLVRFLISVWEMDKWEICELLDLVNMDTKSMLEQSSLKSVELAKYESKFEKLKLDNSSNLKYSALDNSTIEETKPGPSKQVDDVSINTSAGSSQQYSMTGYIKPFYFGGFADLSLTHLEKEFEKLGHTQSKERKEEDSKHIPADSASFRLEPKTWDLASFLVVIWEMEQMEISTLMKVLMEETKTQIDLISRSKVHPKFMFREDSWINPLDLLNPNLTKSEREAALKQREEQIAWQKEKKTRHKEQKRLGGQREKRKDLIGSLSLLSPSSTTTVSSFNPNQEGLKGLPRWGSATSSCNRPPEEALPETWGKRNPHIKCGGRIISSSQSSASKSSLLSSQWLLGAEKTQLSMSLSNISLYGDIGTSLKDMVMSEEAIFPTRFSKSLSRISRNSDDLFEADSEYWMIELRKDPSAMNDSEKRTLFSECIDVVTGDFKHNINNYFCTYFHCLYLWKLKHWQLVTQKRELTSLIVGPTILNTPKEKCSQHGGHVPPEKAKKFRIYLNGMMALERLRLFEITLFGAICWVDWEENSEEFSPHQQSGTLVNQQTKEFRGPKLIRNLGSPTARLVRCKERQDAFKPPLRRRWEYSLFQPVIPEPLRLYRNKGIKTEEITIEVEYLVLNEAGMDAVPKCRYPLLFIEFEFVGHYGHKLESKSRFNEDFCVMKSYNSRERRLLFNMLNKKTYKPLKFLVFSEPKCESSLGKCELIGYTVVNLKEQMVDKSSDIFQEGFPFISSLDNAKGFPIGSLVISVAGHRIMKNIILENSRPLWYVQKKTAVV